MYVKDKQFLANIFTRMSASVTTVNEKIVACRQNKISIESLQTTVALEQLSMMHEALIVLTMLVTDPSINFEPPPELPKKVVGF